MHMMRLLSKMASGQTTASALTSVQLMGQFRAIAHATHHRTNARMTAAGLSLARFRVLNALQSAGRIRMNELSAALRVVPRTVTTIIDALEKEGMVTRLPDPADRRAAAPSPPPGWAQAPPPGKIMGSLWANAPGLSRRWRARHALDAGSGTIMGALAGRPALGRWPVAGPESGLVNLTPRMPRASGNGVLSRSPELSHRSLLGGAAGTRRLTRSGSAGTAGRMEGS